MDFATSMRMVTMRCYESIKGSTRTGNGHIDYTAPGSVVYGFEEFAEAHKSPGFGTVSGNGWYQQSISATNLPGGL